MAAFLKVTSILPGKIEQVINEWKQTVADDFQFEWNARDTVDFSWSVCECTDHNQINLLLNNTEMFLHPIAFHLVGLNRYYTPIGAVWSIQLIPHSSIEWLRWTDLLCSVMDFNKMRIPRLQILIGSTKNEDKEKTDNLQNDKKNLPWNRQTWNVSHMLFTHTHGSITNVPLREVSYPVFNDRRMSDNRDISERIFQTPIFKIPDLISNVPNPDDFPVLNAIYHEGGYIQPRTRALWGPAIIKKEISCENT